MQERNSPLIRCAPIDAQTAYAEWAGGSAASPAARYQGAAAADRAAVAARRSTDKRAIFGLRNL